MQTKKPRIMVPLDMPDHTLRRVVIMENQEPIFQYVSPRDDFFSNHGAKAPRYPEKVSSPTRWTWPPKQPGFF